MCVGVSWKEDGEEGLCVCVCVCTCMSIYLSLFLSLTHPLPHSLIQTHTHTQTQSGVTPDAVTYTTLMEIQAQAGNKEQMEDLVRQMSIKRGFPRDVRAFTAVIRAYGRAGLWRESLELLGRWVCVCVCVCVCVYVCVCV